MAIPRIVDTYENLGIKQTFFVPAWCAENYPKAVEAILKGGHEIGQHGYLHEHPSELSDDEEAYWFHRSRESLERIAGQRPRGLSGPAIQLLASHRAADGRGWLCL